MGAKCSKAPESREQDDYHQTSTPPRFHKTSNGPAPGGHRKRMGFAEVGHLDRSSEEHHEGWGMKFVDSRAQDGEATHNGAERGREDKAKLARAPSGKATSVRSKTSTVAKKGALKVCHFRIPIHLPAPLHPFIFLKFVFSFHAFGSFSCTSMASTTRCGCE